MKKRLATLLFLSTTLTLREPSLFYSKFFKGSTLEFLAIKRQRSE
jgi:hypothetical protein